MKLLSIEVTGRWSEERLEWYGEYTATYPDGIRYYMSWAFGEAIEGTRKVGYFVRHGRPVSDDRAFIEAGLDRVSDDLLGPPEISYCLRDDEHFEIRAGGMVCTGVPVDFRTVYRVGEAETSLERLLYGTWAYLDGWSRVAVGAGRQC